MSAAWVDRLSVALILVAAGAYLLQRAAQRIRTAFGNRAADAGGCGADCGCSDRSTSE